MQKNRGRACCLRRSLPRFGSDGERVSRAKMVSSRSCPKAQHKRSAIFALPSGWIREGLECTTHLESVKYDVKLDSILPSYRVIHLACICRDKQDDGRYDEQQHSQDRMQVTRRHWPDRFTVNDIPDDTGSPKDRSNGKDGEMVQELVEAEECTKHCDLISMSSALTITGKPYFLDSHGHSEEVRYPFPSLYQDHST